MSASYAHFDVAPRLQGLDIPSLTCVDFGCGRYVSDVARQIIDMPWKSLTSVDGYAPDLDAARELKFSTGHHEWVLGDVRSFTWNDGFDVSLAFDCIEHLPREDGEKLLDAIDAHTHRRAVLFVPLEPDGFHRTNPDPANVLQEHISYWREQDFRARGYRVEVLNDIHDEWLPNGKRVVFSALWAIKDFGTA